MDVGARVPLAAPPPTRGWTSPGAGLRVGAGGSPAHAGMDPCRRRSRARCGGLPRPRGDGPPRSRRGPRMRGAPPPTRGWTPIDAQEHEARLGSPAHAGMDPSPCAPARVTTWLPRPRGDGPWDTDFGNANYAAPPPTRGWTHARDRVELPGGSPAHAGMDRARSRRSGWPSRLPRPRGDGPLALHAVAQPMAAPPPTRGWTHARETCTARGIGSPAHAGMDPSVKRAGRRTPRLPRPRGDGPELTSALKGIGKAPPPTRGWTPAQDHGHANRVGSPAHAGMDPSSRAPPACSRRLPRPRGDGPLAALSEEQFDEAPPPTRGWTLRIEPLERRGDGSPAHAGMDLRDTPKSVVVERLPRPRGDGPPVTAAVVQNAEAPPPTRGWTFVVGTLPTKLGGSPAHAGMDPDLRPRPCARRWLPRPRGDGPAPTWFVFEASSAPPPTRGWTRALLERRHLVGGSPAHAGMDPWPLRSRSVCTRLPRPRGDGPHAVVRLHGPEQAPPPTRGWTSSFDSPWRRARGSPAHAGMDPRRRARRRCDRWLPRPRGDGPYRGGHFALQETAPPPTRGWTASRRRRTAPAPGSPAHAGMDPARSGTSAAPRRLPRPRGDGPEALATTTLRAEAPPPTRGWTRGLDPSRLDSVGSPAHAGMDRCSTMRCCASSRLPRPRGDGPLSGEVQRLGTEAPPPTRGWTRRLAAGDRDRRGSPAHAGMDRTRTENVDALRRLPRPRGDGPLSGEVQRLGTEAPPPTRGWTFTRWTLIVVVVAPPPSVASRRRCKPDTPLGADERLIRDPGGLASPPSVLLQVDTGRCWKHKFRGAKQRGHVLSDLGPARGRSRDTSSGISL